jgi:hypothetical protein
VYNSQPMRIMSCSFKGADSGLSVWRVNNVSWRGVSRLAGACACVRQTEAGEWCELSPETSRGDRFRTARPPSCPFSRRTGVRVGRRDSDSSRSDRDGSRRDCVGSPSGTRDNAMAWLGAHC